MSTNSSSASPELDLDSIRRIFNEMSQPEIEILRGVLADVQKLGAGISDVVIEQLARKYADKSRSLVSDGGRT